MKRRNRGIVFLLVGCILFLVAGGWYVYNILEDNNAGKQAEEILEQFEANQEEAVIATEGNEFCGKILIEKLEIELPVYDKWDYTRLKTAPCRYSGGIDSDDIIIAAHNYKSHFGLLGELQIGDEIKFTDVDGTWHCYEVCELVRLDGTAVSDIQSGRWDFTLFTCTKSGKQRITVRCERKDFVKNCSYYHY